jgi:hypothetical protein
MKAAQSWEHYNEKNFFAPCAQAACPQRTPAMPETKRSGARVKRKPRRAGSIGVRIKPGRRASFGTGQLEAKKPVSARGP